MDCDHTQRRVSTPLLLVQAYRRSKNHSRIRSARSCEHMSEEQVSGMKFTRGTKAYAREGGPTALRWFPYLSQRDHHPHEMSSRYPRTRQPLYDEHPDDRPL